MYILTQNIPSSGKWQFYFLFSSSFTFKNIFFVPRLWSKEGVRLAYVSNFHKIPITGEPTFSKLEEGIHLLMYLSHLRLIQLLAYFRFCGGSKGCTDNLCFPFIIPANWFIKMFWHRFPLFKILPKSQIYMAKLSFLIKMSFQSQRNLFSIFNLDCSLPRLTDLRKYTPKFIDKTKIVIV